MGGRGGGRVGEEVGGGGREEGGREGGRDGEEVGGGGRALTLIKHTAHTSPFLTPSSLDLSSGMKLAQQQLNRATAIRPTPTSSNSLPVVVYPHGQESRYVDVSEVESSSSSSSSTTGPSIS